MSEQSTQKQMGEEQLILVERTEGVGVITMNRPEVLNAMNRQLTGAVHSAVAELDNDEDIGCIVITGAGDRALR